MSNAFFNASGNPSTGSQALSSIMRAEFASVAAGFDLLPTLSGNGLKVVTINAGGTAMTVIATTGTGSAVLATSPTLVTPLLGTPTSGTLTNCTGLPIATGVANLGTGVATFLTTPSSANLKTAVTDETGSGALVFANTPTLVTPVLGAATATSINGVTISSTTGTLNVANGKTLTASNTVTITATDSATLAFGAGISITAGKTFACANTITLSGTDSTSLNINAVTVLNSGTYTPTFTNSANCDSFSVGQVTWSRVGNVVTGSGQVSPDFTTANTATSFRMSLPVASNLAAGDDAAGTAVCSTTTVAGTKVPFQIVADAANDALSFLGEAPNNTSNSMTFTFTYEVI